MNAIFSALADPTRRGILLRLSNTSAAPVTEIARPFRISAPAISRHLRVLEEARLIERRRAGREHLIRARPDTLAAARQWINQCAAGWEFSFDALDKQLANEKGKDTKL